MKSLRQIVLSALLTIGLFSAVTYTACKKGGCTTDCKNGGSCYNNACSCPTGFEGAFCQTASRDKFIGVFTGTDSCSNGYSSYQVTLTALSDSLRFNIANINGNSAYAATATITAPNAFSFAGSSFGSNYSGTGKLSNDSLILSYHVQFDTTSYSCVFGGKQHG